jgi:hypothetical protein
MSGVFRVSAAVSFSPLVAANMKLMKEWPSESG